MKKILSMCVLGVLSTHFLHPRAFMPALDMVRKKVETAMQQGNAKSIKDVLEQGGNQITQNVHSQGIIRQGEQIFNLKQSSQRDELVAIKKRLDALYWSAQFPFADSLIEAYKTSRDAAAAVLKQKMQERYQGKTNSITTLAKDLAHEEEELKSIFNDLLKIVAMRDNSEFSKEIGAQHMKQKECLEKIVVMTNRLLI